ncbi:hypothetical protein SUGI_0527310 [Cryptomeria japonica]|nr:uncharacterized protein LOC131068741 isoform X2 [Cryptomeria japonica]GLJ26936.1 hypothetical protein SUGI_0527310 [Cryptomeria japonica]
MSTLMHNAEEMVKGETTPDLAEGKSCIISQSEDDQISNKSVHGLNQTEDIKNDDNMNSLKACEIHANNVPEAETMSSLESSSNVTMVVSKQSLCTASVKFQPKLDREDNKKAFTYEHSDSFENKDTTESVKKGTEKHDRCTPSANSHIIGTSYSRGSPMDWFPRRRTESYLERKIRMLQEVEGMNGTLDETLGGSNPHLSRIEREKLEAQAAAAVAMDAHKAALVEAAWCRILKAARIPCELAEVELQNAEKKAAESFDAASVLGVVMHNKPGSSKQSLEVKTSTANGSQTHIVSASFQTAFEVDKEVAGAVKVAFSHLTHFPASAISDIFNVNDNACRSGNALDTDSIGFDVLSSENDDQTEGEHQTDSDLKKSRDTIDPHTNCALIGKHVTNESFCKPKNHPKSQHSKKEPTDEVGIRDELINLMLERMKLIKEEELVSLAMIVATRGLSAMLKEENKEQELNSKCNSGSLGDILVKHVSRLEAEKAAAAAASKVLVPQDSRKKTTPQTLPDLGSILVKHVSKLEREVQEARKLAKEMQSEDQNNGYDKENRDVNSASNKNTHATNKVNLDVVNPKNINDLDNIQKSNSTSTLPFSHAGTILVKHEMNNATEGDQEANTKQRHYNEEHEERLDKALVNQVSKLEKEKLAALTLERQSSQREQKDQYQCDNLDKILIKHVSQLENMKMAAQEGLHKILKKQMQNDEKSDEGLDKILIKHVSRLERQKLEASPEAFQWVRKQHQHDENNLGSLDKILVKHISRLEREKQEASPEAFQRVQREQRHHDENSWESLDKVFVKHISRLEKEKQEASPEAFQRVKKEQHHHDENSRESLGKILVKHISRLEKEKQEASPEAFQRVKKEQHHHDENSRGSLDKILVKHISRLEKEKQEASPEAFQRVQREQHHHDENSWGSLDKVLVKHMSRLEREKLTAPGNETSQEHENNSILKRNKNARDQEIQHAWRGMSLGNSLRPHFSKLELDKAAWLEAEEEELKRTSKH